MLLSHSRLLAFHKFNLMFSVNSLLPCAGLLGPVDYCLTLPQLLPGTAWLLAAHSPLPQPLPGHSLLLRTGWLGAG